MKETKNNTFYKNDGLIVPGVLLFALIALVSLYPLLSAGYYFYAFVAVGVIVLSFSGYSITEIDFTTRKYREGYMFFGYKTGKWKNIFDFNYVSIVGKNIKTQHRRTLGPLNNPTGTSESYSVYEIRLFKTISQRIVLFSYGSHTKAFKVASLVAHKLNTKLLDATLVPPQFIK